jgi:threonine/homoserine/homoserine lactone efflux protein
MFDYSLAHWATFFTAATLLNLSPGPDMAFILGQTVKRGVKSGFSAMFGIWTGAFIHIIFAALGLSAIVTTSAVAFSIVKWLGAAYLIWLGIQALRSKGTNLSINGQVSKKGWMKTFRQGVLIDVLNPKVAVFFLAFLPQFVEIDAGPVSAQLFVHGILIIVVAAFIEPPLILLSGKLIGYLGQNKLISRWMDQGLGVLFIGLGIKLATTERI